MTHRVYLGITEDKSVTANDPCIMLVWPNIDPRFHIVTRPKFIEANNIGELRAKLIAEIDAKLAYLPGFSSAAAVAAGTIPLGPVATSSLVIQGCSDQEAPKDVAGECFIDLQG